MVVEASPLPQCRADLVIRNTGEGEYVVKLPSSGKYFKIGDIEHFLLSKLDGRNSVQAISQAFEQRFGDPLTAEELDEFIDAVKPLGIFSKSKSGSSSEDSHEEADLEHEADPEFGGKGNLLFYRRTLFNPDAMLNWLEPRLRFLWTRTFVVCSAMAMLAAMSIVWQNRSDLVSTFPQAMRWEAMLMFWVTMIAVTMIHEMAHGLTCKHYGGEVREIGVLFLFFTPCFFCNVTDAWLIPKKSHRLWVTLAGSYSDLCLWALAAFGWRLTVQDSVLNYLAWIVMSICGGRIFFNFNPLMRLDGYYLLSDWLEIPNLRSRSTEYWMAHLRWLLWGADRPAKQPRGGAMLLYGGLIWVFALIFLDVVIFSIFKFLGGKMGPSGMLITGVLLTIALRRVFQGFFSSEFTKMITLRPKRTATWMGLIGGGLVLLFVVPVQYVANGDFEVRPGSLAEIHAPVSGFVKAVYHVEGDHVDADTPIAELQVPDLESQISRKQAEVQEIDAALRRLNVGARPEELADLEGRVNRAAQWRDLAKRDLEQAKLGFEQEISRLDSRMKQTETELKYTVNSVQRAAKLYQARALSGEQYRAEYKRYELAASQLAEAQAAKRSKESEGTRLQESELARREKELADARSALGLMQAGSRPEEIEAANARRDRLIEELSFLKGQKSKQQIRSTAVGTIATPRLQDRIGQLAEMGSLICLVEDVSTLNVEISVSEEEVAGIKPGQSIQLKARAVPFETFTATVDRIAPRAMGQPEKRQSQNSVKVYCHFENQAGKLKSGMTGIARINRGYRSFGLNLINGGLRYLRTEFWW